MICICNSSVVGSEIILRNEEFCNLSEVIVRAEDTVETLISKVRGATILGTWQSTLTDFRYLNQNWKKNCEDERLLGVSLTGVMGHYVLSGQTDRDNGKSVLDEDSELAKLLMSLRLQAIATNRNEADAIGINPSVAISCNKPSGTVSQLTNASSGLHPWHNDYYIRTVRSDKNDPLSKFMVNEGFPYEEDYMNKSAYVFSFPIKADEGSITRNDLTAVQMLEVWLAYQRYWCEHKPSVTINVCEHEWLEVGAFVYKHFDEVSGVSFLPYSDHVYKQAPYQDCTREEYEALLDKMPKNVDWDEVSFYEKEDSTTGTHDLACSAGVCEIVDLTR